MNSGETNKVWEMKALKKPGQEEAMKTLERIAKQVQPIMRKHNWRVKLLSEFCPNNPSLLGVNVGKGIQVKLRLRRANKDWDFIPYEQVLDTMLHELCHNAHGPHNATFYKLWDDLRKECEELISKGISGSGEGFDLPGRRVGGFSRKPPLPCLRAAALSAAEKRARLPCGPKRLGGDKSIMSALSPVQAAAMAAERRLQDDIWCGSEAAGEAEVAGEGTSDSGEEPNRKRSRGSTDFVDLTSDDSPPVSDRSRRDDSDAWECGACTLLNPALALVCEVCSTQKPKDSNTKYKLWSCKFCTLENCVKLDKCCACGQWRFSHGAPIATRAPNLGT